jgi:hypothetical protein
MTGKQHATWTTPLYCVRLCNGVLPDAAPVVAVDFPALAEVAGLLGGAGTIVVTDVTAPVSTLMEGEAIRPLAVRVPRCRVSSCDPTQGWRGLSQANGVPIAGTLAGSPL